MCASRILKRLSPLACCITRSAAFCFSCKRVGNIKPDLPFLKFDLLLHRNPLFTKFNVVAAGGPLSPQFVFVCTFFAGGKWPEISHHPVRSGLSSARCSPRAVGRRWGAAGRYTAGCRQKK